MQNFFSTHSILFLITIGALGCLVSLPIYQLMFLIPNRLHKQWRQQAEQYLHPTTEIQKTIIRPKIIFPWRLKTVLWISFLATLLSLLTAYRFGPHWTTLINLILMWGLLLLACIDFQHGLLPDCITLPLLWLGLLCNSFGVLVPLHEAVWGAILGYGSLWLIAHLFKFCRKKEGLGQGDFKLLAVFGAWYGFYPLYFIVMIASFTGALVGLIQIARRQNTLEKPIPFGPHLIFANIIMLFF